MNKTYSIRVLKAWQTISKEDAEARDFEGVIVNDPSKLADFRMSEANALIKEAVSMKLPRTDYYGKVVHYKAPDDFAWRRIRVVALTPRGRVYKVLGRNVNGTEVKMPLDVLDALN